MRRFAAPLIACLLLIAATEVRAGETAAVAEVPLDGEGIDPAFMERLNRALRDQVEKLGAVTVGHDQVREAHAASPCGGDVACLTRLGAALGARNVLAGHVGVAGGHMHIALQVVEVGSGTQRRAVHLRVPVGEAEARVRALAVEALAMDAYVQSAALVVKTPLAGAEVLVDGVPQGATPLFDPIMLPPGRRDVEVRHVGFKSWRSFVDVAFDETTTLSLEAREGALVPAAARAQAPAAPVPQNPLRTTLAVAGAGVTAAGLVAGVGAAVAWGVAAETRARVYERGQLSLLDDHQTAVTAWSVFLPAAIVAVTVGGGLVGASLME